MLRHTLLDAEQERALARQSLAGDMAARDDLVVHNLRLVHHMSFPYRDLGVERDDLDAEGFLGLLRAARDYDPDLHDVRFSTYARAWIRRRLRDAVDSRDLIRPKKWLISLRQKYARLVSLMGEGAARMELSSRELRALDRTPPSYEGSIDDAAQAEADPLPAERQGQVEDAITRLAPFERWVICQRFGRGYCDHGRCMRTADDPCQGGPPRSQGRTLAELGAVLGFSAEWVRRLESRAIERLRKLIAEPAEPRNTRKVSA